LSALGGGELLLPCDQLSVMVRLFRIHRIYEAIMYIDFKVFAASAQDHHLRPAPSPTTPPLQHWTYVFWFFVLDSFHTQRNRDVSLGTEDGGCSDAAFVWRLQANIPNFSIEDLHCVPMYLIVSSRECNKRKFYGYILLWTRSVYYNGVVSLLQLLKMDDNVKKKFKWSINYISKFNTATRYMNPNIDYYVHSHVPISHYLEFILLELTPLGVSFAIIIEPSQRRDAVPRSTKTTTSGSGKGWRSSREWAVFIFIACSTLYDTEVRNCRLCDWKEALISHKCLTDFEVETFLFSLKCSSRHSFYSE
jgi:hypothetical protein